MVGPLVTPQIGAKRGPKTATAAQQNYLNNQVGQQGTVKPTPVPPVDQSSASAQTGQSASTNTGLSASGISSIPSPSTGASSNPQSMGATPSMGYDSGGVVSDPGGIDTGQGQEGQAGDLSGALSAVQNAYQYGMQMLTGGSNPQFMGGAAQVQPSGPMVNGRPSWSEEDQANLDSTNNTLVGGVIGNSGAGAMLRPAGTIPAKAYIGAIQPTTANAQPMQARGGSVPSFQTGGVMPPPATPQPNQPMLPLTDGGVQGNAPPQIMRYLTGADAMPVQNVVRQMQQMPGHGRAARVVASGQTVQQQYAILQALRRLSDTAGIHAKVSLNGNGKLPPSLHHAVMFANKKFEYTPSPMHISFNLKGKGQQQAARGGSVQSFQYAGNVEPTGDPTMGAATNAAQPVEPTGDPTMGAATNAAQPSDQNSQVNMNVQDLSTGTNANADLSLKDFSQVLGKGYDSLVKSLNNWSGQPDTSKPAWGRTYVTQPIPGSTIPEKAEKGIQKNIINTINPAIDQAKDIADWLSGRQIAPHYHAEAQGGIPDTAPYAKPRPVGKVTTAPMGAPWGDVKGVNPTAKTIPNATDEDKRNAPSGSFTDQQGTLHYPVQAGSINPMNQWVDENGVAHTTAKGPFNVGQDLSRFDNYAQKPSDAGAIPFTTTQGTPGITPGAPQGIPNSDRFPANNNNQVGVIGLGGPRPYQDYAGHRYYGPVPPTTYKNYDPRTGQEIAAQKTPQTRPPAAEEAINKSKQKTRPGFTRKTQKEPQTLATQNQSVQAQQPNEALPMPQTKEQLLPGRKYITSRGPALWTGQQFMPISEQ